jgi:hypothetical protein
LPTANKLILQLDKAQDLRSLTAEEAWLQRVVKALVLGLASLDRTIARPEHGWLGSGWAEAKSHHLPDAQ